MSIPAFSQGPRRAPVAARRHRIAAMSRFRDPGVVPSRGTATPECGTSRVRDTTAPMSAYRDFTGFGFRSLDCEDRAAAMGRTQRCGSRPWSAITRGVWEHLPLCATAAHLACGGGRATIIAYAIGLILLLRGLDPPATGLLLVLEVGCGLDDGASPVRSRRRPARPARPGSDLISFQRATRSTLICALSAALSKETYSINVLMHQ